MLLGAAGLGGLGLAAAALCGADAGRGFEVADARLHAGDLLFRRTVSLEGLGVQALDAAGRFSHVGLVVGRDAAGKASVVHACPPERADQTGVRQTTAQDFVGAADVRDAAAFRLPHVSTLQRAHMATWAHAHVGWAFNADFSLNAPHALYCTELVYRAMKAAGVQPLPRLARWFTPLGRREVLPLSALLALPGLRPVPQACRRRSASDMPSTSIT